MDDGEYGWFVAYEGMGWIWRKYLTDAIQTAKDRDGVVYEARLAGVVADYRPPQQCPATWTANSRCWLNVHPSDPEHVSLDGDSIRAWHGEQGLDRDPRRVPASRIKRAVLEHAERERHADTQ